METRFQVDYQTIDQTKRMIVKAPDQAVAGIRAKEYLRRKHGEIFSILRIVPIGGKEIWEQIAFYVMEGNF